MDSASPKMILSVDGGGVRGIIPLACLIRLESRLGKSCRDIFSMAAGTSTGAVIAAGVALGVSARGILALYRDLAKEVFRGLPWWEVLLNGGNHRYKLDFIGRVLTEMGAHVPLNDLPIDVLITAKNTETSRTDFFVRDQPGNAARWGRLSLRDAVLASVAAPTYFPPHQASYEGRPYVWVDGGVGVAGNPCFQAAVEALYFSGGAYTAGSVRMLTFGTGRSPHAIDAPRANIVQWGGWVLSELLEDAGDWQTYITRREYGLSGRVDVRRYQLDLTMEVMRLLGVEVPPGREVGAIGMDAAWAVELLEQIGRAFADRIDFDDSAGLDLGASSYPYARRLP
ncbi:MAG TPA: patatin-like phospholipase family protein [Anaerolineales bacterium]|nr:patatin-like phospholipase family protein [Anaerolineales bacterium]